MTRTKDKNYAAIAARYAGDVVSGKILACQWTIKACQRQIDDLERAKSRAGSVVMTSFLVHVRIAGDPQLFLTFKDR